MIKKYDFGDDIKICLIADIHFEESFNIKRLNKILLNIELNKPDYVCIVGDIIDYVEASFNEHIEYLYDFIKKIAKTSKVIISLGNHDITTFKDSYLYPYLFLENIKHIKNVVILDNNTFVDKNIRFIGYTQSYDTLRNDYIYDDIIIEEINKLTKDLDNKYNIILSHNPLYITKKSLFDKLNNKDKIDLILSGHTHNGMLPNFIKTNNLLISPNKKFFYKNGRGYLKLGKCKVIITGGITKLSRKAKILRYFNFLYQMNIDYINVSINKDTKDKI